MTTYHNLTTKHIDLLKSQGCTANDWGEVWIQEEKSLSKIKNVCFSGTVKIGSIKGENTSFGGVVRANGIYNVHLHNCEIGNNPFIKDVKNYIANYRIGNNIIIENIGHLAVEGTSTFGNGTCVEAINEGGGREITIYDGLSAQIAYILSLYRHRDKVIKYIKEFIQSYTEDIRSSTGLVGDGVEMINCRSIKNVNIGAHAKLEGVVSLKNGSLNSFKDAPIYIGSEVMAENFIISSDTIIDNATILSNCFVGQGCVLDKHYSAEHSVFFANSQGFNGEACSIFAGPYTVTHHKSTLLIAGMFSFMNAGSGSNQSNHMYKLGPIHQGIMERGAKTTSNSYIMWPSKVGAFTLVSGRHSKNVDSSDFPFSYLIESKDHSYLIPGINLKSVGTVRDSKKWPKRDRRNQTYRTDIINFNLLSPYTIHKVDKGLEILKALKEKAHPNTKEYKYGSMKITSSALKKGIQIYEIIIHKFLGNSLISCIDKRGISSIKDLQKITEETSNIGKGKWLDVSGLLCPIESLSKVLDQIEKRKIDSLSKIQLALEEIHQKYYEYEWNWANSLIEKYYGIYLSKICARDVIKIVKQWKKSVVDLDNMLYKDAQKEFSLSTQVGFGVDGNLEERNLDFASVRGNFENNATVVEILNHIERKTALGNSIIEAMEKINPE